MILLTKNIFCCLFLFIFALNAFSQSPVKKQANRAIIANKKPLKTSKPENQNTRLKTRSKTLIRSISLSGKPAKRIQIKKQ